MSLQPLSPPLASPSPVPSMTNSISSYDPLAQTLPIVLGYVSVFCFTLQYVPQLWLNYSRKSVKGFSTTGIIIKFIGSSFHFFTALVQHEKAPVLLYGLSNSFQNCLFMIQFAVYTGDRRFYRWLLMPVVPFLLLSGFPFLAVLASVIKPAGQIVSHIPQLHTCWTRKTTLGVSRLSQHLNMIGGLSGLYMCYRIPPNNPMTYVVYLNSVFQAGSMYALCIMFDGMAALFSDSAGTSTPEDGDESRRPLRQDSKPSSPVSESGQVSPSAIGVAIASSVSELRGRTNVDALSNESNGHGQVLVQPPSSTDGSSRAPTTAKDE